MYAMTAVHSAVHSDDWRILSNHAALLSYIDMRMKSMSCSPENRDRIFAVCANMQRIVMSMGIVKNVF